MIIFQLLVDINLKKKQIEEKTRIKVYADYVSHPKKPIMMKNDRDFSESIDSAPPRVFGRGRVNFLS